ncbi:MAG TPA: patatin-like phospholipase family protein [Actinocrinis sp.]|uniref:patatin-like phospholipase family protein n=1 Tax=Actinocrinis sp. TaxID=1920516 RepID=UPI002DDD99EA|nr:patatin-like phospholipase family protein [Actinocrinis sp.]HEV2344916.1 patatin-like phospholipase family protein [Actinocrinis sp.]
MGNERKPVDLVLEGGGVKGIALLGAVLHLYDEGYRFPRIAGTSAGAIVAALVASYQKDNRDLHELGEVMYDVPYSQFAKESPLQRATGKLGDYVEFMLREGMHKSDILVEWLGPILAARGVRTFADLSIDDPQTSLQPYQRYAIVVHTSDVSRKVLVRLPWDYDQYGFAAAEQQVVEAVRASMSIPFFFRPVQLATNRGQVTWVDGGMLSNFPITAFDRTDGRPPRWPTWGIKLSSAPSDDLPDTPVTTALEIAVHCLETLTSEWNRYGLAAEGVNQRTIYVDTSGYSSRDFNLDRAAQSTLLGRGQAAAQAFLTQNP